MFLAVQRVFWTPALIGPGQQTVAQFSEARAFQHVQVLADDIGFRLVSLQSFLCGQVVFGLPQAASCYV